MKYAFVWDEYASRQLRDLPQQTALRILHALTPLGEDPRRPDADIKKLVGLDDLYRLRVGDYRVVYEIRGGELLILVIGVGHRRDIYRIVARFFS